MVAQFGVKGDYQTNSINRDDHVVGDLSKATLSEYSKNLNVHFQLEEAWKPVKKEIGKVISNSI